MGHSGGLPARSQTAVVSSQNNTRYEIVMDIVDEAIGITLHRGRQASVLNTDYPKWANAAFSDIAPVEGVEALQARGAREGELLATRAPPVEFLSEAAQQRPAEIRLAGEMVMDSGGAELKLSRQLMKAKPMVAAD